MGVVMEKCAFCREELEGQPVEHAGKLYCCEACAFEDSKKKGAICGSRESVETSLKFLRSAKK